ncbi:MAG: hypothetical protein L3J66_03070 [Bacteroidales bacterium]|nr:hypothetical protein [Bacteroidales bacterium]
MQKKKSQGTAPGKVARKKSVLESLMDEFLEKQEPLQPDAAVYDESPNDTEIEEKKDAEVFSYDDVYEESNYNEVSDVLLEKPPVKTRIKTELKKPLINRKIRKFDLRKAVIYSEILNRRYF